MEKEEYEIRLKETWETIANNGADIIKVNGETLTQLIGNLNQKINQLEKELEDSKKNNTNSSVIISPISTNPVVNTPSADEIAWNNFFLNKADITNQADWKNSGLSIKDVEEVYKNGWKDQISNIVNGKINYKGDNLDARLINKEHLDTANSLLQEINDPNKNTFQKLPENFKEQEIQALSNFDDQLPEGKKSTDLKQAIKTRRNNFVYRLNEPNNEFTGDGLNQTELDNARKKTETRWTIETGGEEGDQNGFNKVTLAVLKEVLAEELDTIPADRINEPEIDLVPWLKKQGGYEIDKETTPYMLRDPEDKDRKEKSFTGQEIWAKEEQWIKEGRVDMQGTLFLPYLYKKFNFEPDKIRDGSKYGEGNYIESNFCKAIDKKVYFKDPKNPAGAKIERTIKVIDKESSQGLLPFPTASGKSTKFTYELVRGGLENVILVVPNKGLGQEIYNYHNTWLRSYRCAYHLESHGTYPLAINDLCYYLNGNNNNNPEGKKGLSILEDWCLDVFLNRELVKNKYGKGGDLCEGMPDTMKKFRMAGKEHKDFEKNVKAIKDKLIPKDDTIILFDEADFALDATYPELPLQAVLLKYKVMMMSATFKGEKINPITKKKEPIPFSITTSYPRTILRQSILNISDEELAKSKTLVFLKNAQLTETQKDILKANKIFYCEFDETALSSSTGITKATPPGSLFFADSRMERGYTPFVDIVILTNRTQTRSLGSYRTVNGKKSLVSSWEYGEPEEQNSPLSSIMQGGGRVSRISTGKVIIFNNFKRTKDENGEEVDITEEIDTFNKNDFAYKFLKATLDGDTSALPQNLKNINFIRAGIVLPYMFGRRIEEVLVGLGGLGGFPPNYPTYGNKPNGTVDQGLWERHLGIKKEVKIDPERGKRLLCLMIETQLQNEFKFPEEIRIGFDSPLIKDTNLTIEEAWEVLTTVLEEKLEKIDGYKRGKDQFSGAEVAAFKATVKSYRMVNNLEIDIYWQYKDKDDHSRGCKDELFLSIIYPKLPQEELDEFNKSYRPYKGESEPPKAIDKRSLGKFSPQNNWTCKECRVISWEGDTCRNCGSWKYANSQRREDLEMKQEAKIEIPAK